MKIKQAKRIVLILLATMLAAFCLVSLAFVVKYGDVDKSVYADPPYARYTDLESVTVDNWKDYKDDTNFKISNPTGWINFKNLIDGNKTGFKDKRITLISDLNLENLESATVGYWSSVGTTRIFQGEFDGYGHTIYNAKFTIVKNINSRSTGLFYRTGANSYIHDLQIYNASCTFSTNKKDNGNTIGAISGYGDGKIETCLVNNFAVYVDGTAQQTTYLGGVIGEDVGGDINNCAVKNINFSILNGDLASRVYSGGICGYNDKNTSIIDCVANEEQFSGVDKLICGSDDSFNDLNIVSPNIIGSLDTVLWYYNSSFSKFNDGYPMLRKFMYFKDYYFYGDGNGCGYPNPLYNVPALDYGDNPIITTSGKYKYVYGYTVEACPNDGYDFDYWSGSGTVYYAHFKIKQYTIKFSASTGDVSVSPSSSQNFTVNYGTSISGPSNGATGTVSYTFGSHTVTYDIPTGYYFDSDKRPQQITSDCTITPNILELKYDINIGGEGGTWGDWSSVGASSASLTGIVYGTEIQYSVTTTTIVLKMSGQQKVFTANSGYEIEYLQINDDYYHPGDTGTITVKSQIDIYACALKLYEITFAEAIDDERSSTDKYGQTGIATLTANPKTIKIKQGKSVTAEYTARTRVLTFKYNGNVVATYTGKEYYAILQDADKDEIKEVNDSSDLTIQPTFTFYACLVTMTKADNENISEMYVGGSKIASGEHKLIVEFGTVVNFTASQSNGLFTYTYRFSSGEVVEYKITDDKYAMSSEKDSDTRMWHTELEDVMRHTFDGPEDGYVPTDDMQYKTISPTFELKQYSGNLG